MISSCITFKTKSIERWIKLTANFYRAILCITVYAGMRCLSVCLSVRLSVTFVSSVKTNKHIFEILSPSGSQAILVFTHQMGWRYSDGNTPNGGVECKGV